MGQFQGRPNRRGPNKHRSITPQILRRDTAAVKPQKLPKGAKFGPRNRLSIRLTMMPRGTLARVVPARWLPARRVDSGSQLNPLEIDQPQTPQVPTHLVSTQPLAPSTVGPTVLESRKCRGVEHPGSSRGS